MKRGGLSDTRFKDFQDAHILVSHTDASPKQCRDTILTTLYPSDTISVIPMFPNGCEFFVTGGTTFESEEERAHARNLLLEYQPMGSMWPVVEVTSSPFTFTTTFQLMAGTRIPQLIFGGR